METEAMYEGGDVACMVPRIFDRTSCRMPGSVQKSLLMSAIWHGIVSRPDSTGSVYGRRLKEIKEHAFLEKAYENCIT